MYRKKQRLYNKAKKARTHKEQSWAKYNAHKKATSKALNEDRLNYINGILQAGIEEGNNKPLYRYLYSQKNDQSGVAPLNENGNLHSNSTDKANVLN